MPFGKNRCKAIRWIFAFIFINLTSVEKTNSTQMVAKYAQSNFFQIIRNTR